MADAIWNNNYILSNMAANDLYVQSPLYTGQSGDSAYIGWNNETVLYDNYSGRPQAVGSNIELSESPLNFESVEIYLNGSTTAGTSNQSNGFMKVSNSQLAATNTLNFMSMFNASLSTAGIYEMGAGYSGTSGSTWTKWYGYAKNVTSTAAEFTNATHLNIYKVVGINRKRD